MHVSCTGPGAAPALQIDTPTHGHHVHVYVHGVHMVPYGIWSIWSIWCIWSIRSIWCIPCSTCNTCTNRDEIVASKGRHRYKRGLICRGQLGGGMTIDWFLIISFDLIRAGVGTRRVRHGRNLVPCSYGPR